MKLIAALVDKMPLGCSSCLYASRLPGNRWVCDLIVGDRPRECSSDEIYNRWPRCPLVLVRDWHGEKLSKIDGDTGEVEE